MKKLIVIIFILAAIICLIFAANITDKFLCIFGYVLAIIFGIFAIQTLTD
jgi:hypothetical protein